MGSQKNKAAEEAQRAEEARQAAIAATQGRVNQVFDSPQREADILAAGGDLRAYLTRDLEKQKGDTDRALRFALARGGQIGGSTQRDQAAEFGRAFQKGTLDVENRAQGFMSGIRAADEDARARLISLATSGLDTTTGASRAAAALQSNLQGGRAQAWAEGLGDVFRQFSDFAQRRREEYDRRRGLSESGFSLYQPMNTGSGYGGG